MKAAPSLSRRQFCHSALGASGALLLQSLISAGCGGHRRKPNILLVLTDDQGFGDLSLHGNPVLETPHLDALAASGARFDRFYVSPVCAPTRASLLTGRYHLRTGTTWVTRGKDAMRTEEVTLAEVLKQDGYATGCFGKWHNGEHWPEHPCAQGFDEFLGFCAGVWNNYFDAEIDHNGKKFATQGYLPDVLTGAAIDFMKSNRDHPFFCYVPLNTPHTPLQVPDRYFDKYKAKGLDDTLAAVYGMVENIDDNVARMLSAVDELGLKNDTIVLFLSDNGPFGNRYNARMRGTKGSFYDGGIRVPCFIRWPGVIRPGTVIHENAAHIDLLPTLATLCHVSTEGTLPLDGKNLTPLLSGKAADWPDRSILILPFGEKLEGWENNGVCTRQWRAVLAQNNWELYRIDEDPEQKNNVAAQHPEVIGRLSGEYERMFREMTGRGLDALPVQVGHAQWPEVMLGGHEARLLPENTPGIAYNYSMGWSNNWISNWSNPEAYPEWRIAVVKAGTYRISLPYLCAKEHLGCTLRVEVGNQFLETTIQEEHNPAPEPSPFRIPAEAVKYETKTFKTLSLGTLDLPEGETAVRVRLKKVVGGKGADIQGVLIEPTTAP